MFPSCRVSSTGDRKGINQFLLTDIMARLVFCSIISILCWPSCHMGLHICDQLHLQDKFLKWIQDNQYQTHLNLCVSSLAWAQFTWGHLGLFYTTLKSRQREFPPGKRLSPWRLRWARRPMVVVLYSTFTRGRDRKGDMGYVAWSCARLC